MDPNQPGPGPPGGEPGRLAEERAAARSREEEERAASRQRTADEREEVQRRMLQEKLAARRQQLAEEVIRQARANQALGAKAEMQSSGEDTMIPPPAGAQPAVTPQGSSVGPEQKKAIDAVFTGSGPGTQQGAPRPPVKQPPAQSRQPTRTLQPQPGAPTTTRPGAKAPASIPPAPQPGPITAEWKVLEPEDPSDPVEHEVFDLRPRSETWQVMAASLRGKLHAHKAMWRDDAFEFAWVDDWTIIALSDGAGSARLARIGARIACAQAVDLLRQVLADYQLSPGTEEVPAQEDQDRLRDLLIKAAGLARAGIIQEAERRQCPTRDFNATFLLAIHAPFKDSSLVGAIQVGDGAIGVYTADDVCRLVGVGDHGQYSSETCFLTTPGIEEQLAQRVRFAVFKKDVRGLAVMCDGVSDDFFPEDKRLIELFNGNPVKELKTKQGEPVWGLMHKDRGILRDPQGGKALLDWLRYEKRGSSDDRTLVLMYRRE
jgi:hypothetical protein